MAPPRMGLVEVAPERARAAAEQAHQLYREVGDVHGLYAELTGLAGMWSEPNEKARAALEEALSLERPEWPARERAWGQRAQADVARAEGDLANSRLARETELKLRIEAGEERGSARRCRNWLTWHSDVGDVDDAVRLGIALVARLRTLRSPSMLYAALCNLMRRIESPRRCRLLTHFSPKPTRCLKVCLGSCAGGSGPALVVRFWTDRIGTVVTTLWIGLSR